MSTVLKATYVSSRSEKFIVPDSMKVVELARALILPGETLKRVEVVNGSSSQDRPHV